MANRLCSFPTGNGFSLLEMVVVLTVMGATVGALLPAARRQVDRMAVLSAREEVVGLFHRAREEAIARGTAQLVVHTDPPRVELLSGPDTLARTGLYEVFGVTLGLSRDREEARLAFGALGLGQITSQTLRFGRGEAEASLVVSSLGRVVKR